MFSVHLVNELEEEEAEKWEEHKAKMERCVTYVGRQLVIGADGIEEVLLEQLSKIAIIDLPIKIDFTHFLKKAGAVTSDALLLAAEAAAEVCHIGINEDL